MIKCNFLFARLYVWLDFFQYIFRYLKSEKKSAGYICGDSGFECYPFACCFWHGQCLAFFSAQPFCL